VLALFADSTNIDRRGFTGSEREVIEAFEEIFTSTAGRVVVAAFASSIYRMQILVDLAVQFDRKVAFLGRGMIQNSEIAQRLGYLHIPAGTQVRDSDINSYPAQDVLCVVTGSQGEPMAALSRIAIDDHRCLKLGSDDTVVLSARAIPGNEKAIGRVVNHIARRHRSVYEIKHARVRPWQRGRAEAHALARQAALLRPDSWGMPASLAARQDRARVFAGRDPRLKCCLPKTAICCCSTSIPPASAERRPSANSIDGHTGEVADEVLGIADISADGLVVRYRHQQADRRAEGVPDHHTRLRHGR
jgi:mRNA degradation ribonuclease J1/J2